MHRCDVAAPAARESRSASAELSASNAAVNSSTARSHARDRIAAPPSCGSMRGCRILPLEYPRVRYRASWGKMAWGEPKPSAGVARISSPAPRSMTGGGGMRSEDLSSGGRDGARGQAVLRGLVPLQM